MPIKPSLINRCQAPAGMKMKDIHPLIKSCSRDWKNNSENVIYLSSAVNDIIKKLNALTTRKLEKVDSTCRLLKLPYRSHYSCDEYLLRSLLSTLSSISNKFLDKLPSSHRKEYFSGNPDFILNINLSPFNLLVKSIFFLLRGL